MREAAPVLGVVMAAIVIPRPAAAVILVVVSLALYATISVIGYGIAAGGYRTMAASRCVAGWPTAKPFALYLRSFEEDSAPLPVRVAGTPLLEEYLAALSPLPIVGLANYTAQPPPLGPTWLRAGAESWQREVTHLLRSSRAIILRPSASAGFAWELQAVAQHALLDKLVLLVPHDDFHHTLGRSGRNPFLQRKLEPMHVRWERVRLVAEEALALRLPAWRELGTTAVLSFSAAGATHPHPKSTRGGRRPSEYETAREIAARLRCLPPASAQRTLPVGIQRPHHT